MSPLDDPTPTVNAVLPILAPFPPLTLREACTQLAIRQLDALDPNTPLDQHEWDRFQRLLAVLERATEVHKSTRNAAIWCLAELPALGRQTPIQKCQTERGYKRVLGLLGQIEHGIFG